MDFKTSKRLAPPNIDRPLGQRLGSLFSQPSFKSWFGQSRVVDENSNPMVVFRGTRREPLVDNEFRLQAGRDTPSFTDDPVLASVYTRKSQVLGPKQYGNGSTVTPVFLSIQNPLDISGFGEQISLYDLIDSMGIDVDEMDTPVIASIYASLYATAEDVGAEFDDFMGSPADFFQKFDKRDPISKFKTLRAIEFDSYVVADSLHMVGHLERLGFDGVFHAEVTEGAAPYYHGPRNNLSRSVTFRPFAQTQIKSAIGNNGCFDPKDPRTDR